MDIRRYYRELRELEAQIAGKDIFVTSLETPDGGKAGQVAQVAKRAGCKLIVEGRARLASAAEISAYEKEQVARHEATERERLASRLQIQLVTEPREASADGKSKQG